MGILYRTKATATGGRDGGHVASDDDKLSTSLAMPKELGGPGGDATNPEQLFAAGYAACFLSALKFVAAQDKVVVTADSTVTVSVGVGPRPDGTGFGLEVAIAVALPGVDPAAAEALVAKAHIVCPYSHATRGNLDIHPTVSPS